MKGLAWVDRGPKTAIPLVFIHGFPFDHTMWQPQLEVFSKKYRVIAYDLRGHGDGRVGDGQYTVELFVDDLLALMDHLKVRRAVICGLSLGGYIALRAVQRHPDRFSGLVLCDTKSGADSNKVKLKRAATMRALKKDGVGPFAKEFIRSVLSEDSLKTKPKVKASVLKMIRANTVRGICGTLLALAARTETTSALPRMKLPTLVLVGEEDKLTPPSVAETMVKAMPWASMHVIPQAGHLSNLENPDDFNRQLEAFLQKFVVS